LKAPDPLQPPPYPMPTHPIDRLQSPEQRDMLFSGYERVYGPQNAPLLWQCIIPITLEYFEGHRPSPTSPKSIYTCLGGCMLAIRCVVAGCESSCGVLGDHFHGRLPLLCLFSVDGLMKLDLGQANCQMPNLFYCT
jgi:hypothetical protein